MKYLKDKVNPIKPENELEEPINSITVTSDDKVWAAFSYWIPFFALIAIFTKEKKTRPYIKFNAVQSLVTIEVLFLITLMTLGFGITLFLLMFRWGYLAYQGQDVKIPMISDFIRNQGWA